MSGKNIILKISTYLLLILACSNVSVQAQSVRALSTADSLQAGEIFDIYYVVSMDQKYDEVRVPDSSLFNPNLTYIKSERYRLNELTDSLVYRFQYFDNTNNTVAPKAFTFILGQDTTRVFSEPIPLYFKSLLEADTSMHALKAEKPLFSFDRFPWFWLILMLLLISALAYWYWTKSMLKEDSRESDFTSVPEFINPILELEHTLDSIKEIPVLEVKSDYKLYYSSISDGIRKYYEDVHQIPALESTTRQLLVHLEQQYVDEDMVRQTAKVLKQADMVKFAKYEPSIEKAKEVLDLAYRFLEIAQQKDLYRIERLRKKHEEKYKPKAETEDMHGMG